MNTDVETHYAGPGDLAVRIRDSLRASGKDLLGVYPMRQDETCWLRVYRRP